MESSPRRLTFLAWGASLLLAIGCGRRPEPAPAPAPAQVVQVAVASNFAAPMRALAEVFEKNTGYKAQLSFGSTGKFYAQIKEGAPFDVLLAADDETPGRLMAENAAVPDSRFTYATGRLALWSAKDGLVDGNGAVLKVGTFAHLALADPKLAPYGAAAVEAMKHLGVFEQLQPKFVQGENITQTQQFVNSGNAELGFVALSQVSRDGRIAKGSAWIVPRNLHSALRQDAILLTHGKGNSAAAALLGFLKTEKARTVIQSYGYDME